MGSSPGVISIKRKTDSTVRDQRYDIKETPRKPNIRREGLRGEVEQRGLGRETQAFSMFIHFDKLARHGEKKQPIHCQL
jgi:hypothetical protein